MHAAFAQVTGLFYLPSCLPDILAPAQSSALVASFIIPCLLGIWLAHTHRISKLRQGSLRMRQLELRLAAAKPMICSAPTTANRMDFKPLSGLSTPSTASPPRSIPVLPRVPFGCLKVDRISARGLSFADSRVLMKGKCSVHVFGE